MKPKWKEVRENAERNKRIEICVSADEFEVISRRAKKLNMKVSAYLRKIGTLGEIIIFDTNGLFELRTAINRIGNNINQIAAAANSNKNISQRDMLCFLSENKIHFFSGLKYELDRADEKYCKLKEEKADEKLIAEAAERRKVLAAHYSTYLDCMKTDYERIVEESREYYRLVSDSVTIKPEGAALDINYYSEISRESVTPQSKPDLKKWAQYYGISEQEKEITDSCVPIRYER